MRRTIMAFMIAAFILGGMAGYRSAGADLSAQAKTETEGIPQSTFLTGESSQLVIEL